METTKKERLCYIRPVRALRRMKNADEDGQTVYIFGVTGIGKTELFTRYLDGREYRLLNGRKIDPEALKPEKKETRQIIVIDDLHNLVFDPNQEEIKEQITTLFSQYDLKVLDVDPKVNKKGTIEKINIKTDKLRHTKKLKTAISNFYNMKESNINISE